MSDVVLYRDPTLADIYLVCSNVQADQVEQFEAFTGQKYDAGVVSASYHLRPGPKWVLTERDQPIGVAGFDHIRPGVWQDWMFTTERCWDPHWRAITKHTRRAMDAMLKTEAHRLQCVSLASRIHAHKWYRVLGLQLEGTLRGYGANGEDALMFARTRGSL